MNSLGFSTLIIGLWISLLCYSYVQVDFICWSRRVCTLPCFYTAQLLPLAAICYSRGTYIDTLSPRVLTLRYDTPLAWHVPLVWPNIWRHVLPSSVIPSCFTLLSILWALPAPLPHPQHRSSYCFHFIFCWICQVEIICYCVAFSYWRCFHLLIYIQGSSVPLWGLVAHFLSVLTAFFCLLYCSSSICLYIDWGSWWLLLSLGNNKHRCDKHACVGFIVEISLQSSDGWIIW